MNEKLSPDFKPLPVLTLHKPEVWRSLQEREDSEEYRKHLETEFPTKHELWMDDISRRDFLKVMGAGFAMMAFAGCRKPMEMIFPYNENPENLVPGKPLYYATSIPFRGYAQGALVESHEGKPSKVEGLPDHPDSLGATDIFMQSTVLTLYDPDRSQAVIHESVISSWDRFLATLQEKLRGQESVQGAGLRILLEPFTSPSMQDLLSLIQRRFPKAKWGVYDPLNRDQALEGARLAFGSTYETRYNFEKAKVILSLDSDFFYTTPGKLRYARHFAKGRDLLEGKTEMNRLYVAEPSPTLTGSNADHRLAISASDIGRLARHLAGQLGALGGGSEGGLSAEARRWIEAVARDLQRHRGRSLVLVGDAQPAVVHALAHAINDALGNAGRTVLYQSPVRVTPQDSITTLKELTNDLEAKKVECLLMVGGNPVYDAPADLEFAKKMDGVPFRVHLATHEDETSRLCHWHIPQAHVFETWSDFRASDGSVSIAQPLIEPLYAGRSPQELLSAIAENSPRSAHDLVKNYWKTRSGSLDFERLWEKSVHDGLVPGTEEASRQPALRSFRSTLTAQTNDIEIVFMPDPTIWDGQYANNSWLQELPKPMTKLTWDNAALVSPSMAEQLRVENGDMVKLSVNGRSMVAPVWVTPGQAERSVAIYLGYGRTSGGQVAKGRGFDAYPLRTSTTMAFATGLQIKAQGDSYKLASTQIHHSMDGRDLVRDASLEEYKKKPDFAFDKKDWPEETLYNGPTLDDQVAWGMTIDNNLCTGCNACVLGCQSENNIPTVGKDQVALGREMQWLRIDSYFKGDAANPDVLHQPVPCMHCENAPCEPVCPVGATVHSDEGLNEMVYNRCIGTRYCSNNCPYKVRRFNFFRYADYDTPILKMLNNPDVTVRGRGVMEKCTYCVQRINGAKILAEKEGRPVGDGEIVTACQGACPTQAITFGNLKDKKSKVAQRKEEPRHYALLGALGVRPRTTYLAKVRNLNPELS